MCLQPKATISLFDRSLAMIVFLMLLHFESYISHGGEAKILMNLSSSFRWGWNAFVDILTLVLYYALTLPSLLR